VFILGTFLGWPIGDSIIVVVVVVVVVVVIVIVVVVVVHGVHEFVFDVVPDAIPAVANHVFQKVTGLVVLVHSNQLEIFAGGVVAVHLDTPGVFVLLLVFVARRFVPAVVLAVVVLVFAHTVALVSLVDVGRPQGVPAAHGGVLAVLETVLGIFEFFIAIIIVAIAIEANVAVGIESQKSPAGAEIVVHRLGSVDKGTVAPKNAAVGGYVFRR
jgi:hypothetical protein